MSATPSKLFAGFIGFILSVCLFSGVGIAEQIVETESRVVLEVGSRGILPCRIQRKAHLVQWTWWTRELASEHHLVYLDPYSTVRRRGGPGYKEGLFNITEDYSLIIKDVKVRDAGLYICELSDLQTGKVFRNRTRVSVQGYGIGTDAQVVLQKGARGILPCSIQWRAYTVKWKRQQSSETKLLVSLDTYFDVGERDGPGYEAGLFNITDDYSLVIKDVKVQDEGLYLCTFSDYKTGKVFRNATRVSVLASPDEPFPIIQECNGKYVHPKACTLTVDSTLKLTCFVVGYYPNIDLFFLHGYEKMASTEYEELDNADGTKNKNITVRISVSDEPYQCIASGLPGIAGNKSVSVIVQAHPQGRNVAAIVVAVVFVVTACLSIAAFLKRYLKSDRVRGSKRRFMPRETGSKHTFYLPVPAWTPTNAPKGPVSKPELWKMVTTAKENNSFKKLRKVLVCLRHLSKTDVSQLDEDDDFYESLCMWKSETSSDSDQRETLYSICSKVGMSDINRTLKDFVMDTSDEISRGDIKHILKDIGDTGKIIELLKTLGLNHEAAAEASETGETEVINVAGKELKKWRNGDFDINPLVTLSLKLDELGCDTNFFKIPMVLKEVMKRR